MQILTWLSTQLDLGQILRFNVHFGIVCREGWFNFVYQWAIYTVLLTLSSKLFLTSVVLETQLLPCFRMMTPNLHSLGKESACNAGDTGSIPGLGRSPEEGNGNPLQYSCLRNPMNRGA